MKKAIILLLAFVMVLSSVGCGGYTKEPEPTATPTPTANPEPTEKPKMTRSEALAELKYYLNLHNSEISNKLASRASVSSARNVTIATFEDGGFGFWDKDKGYGFKMKGKFYGYDSYGKLEHIYSFEWAAVVEDVYGTIEVRLSSNPSVFR